MILFLYGASAISCVFLFASMVGLAARQLTFGDPLWHNGYFWLCSFGSLVSLGFMGFAFYRTVEILGGGELAFVQPKVAAISMVVVTLLGFMSGMRAIAINRPGRGKLYLLAIAAWLIFCALLSLL